MKRVWLGIGGLRSSSERPGPTTFSPEVRRGLPVLLAQRLVLNTGGRMVFTYLPALSAGTGLSVAAMGRIIFARDLTGVLGPAVGRVVGHRGSWTTMWVAGLVAAAAMALVVAAGPIGVVVGFVVWGACRTAFLVAGNSWIGDVVAYERRGRATGLVELTWAAAALIGLPVIGLLIGAFGWWAAPVAMVVTGGPVALLAALTPEPAGQRRPRPEERQRLTMQRTTIVGLVGLALLVGAAQFLFFTHGLWLADTYGFDATEVAFAILVVGGSEACGSLATIRIADAVGKRTAVLAGGSLLGAAMVGLAFTASPPLAAGLALLVAAFLGSEFAIVSSLALVSELEPDNRSAVVGLSTGLSTVARATVSLAAGWAYVTGGVRLPMLLGAITVGASLVIIGFVISEPASRQPITGR